VKSI